MEFKIRTKDQKDEAMKHLDLINHIIDECETNDIPTEHLYAEKHQCELALEEYFSLCEPACDNDTDADGEPVASIPDAASPMREDYRNPFSARILRQEKIRNLTWAISAVVVLIWTILEKFNIV